MKKNNIIAAGAASVVCSIGLIIGIVKNTHQELRVSQQGLAIIGNEEGCRLKPYYCPANVLTVGIGSTEAGGLKIDINKRYTNEEIAQRWANDLAKAENCVNRYANGATMPQGAYDALTSITFNVGCGALKNSTLFKMARQGYNPNMCQQFSRWVYAGGKKLNGLVKRRESETKLCLGI